MNNCDQIPFGIKMNDPKNLSMHLSVFEKLIFVYELITRSNEKKLRYIRS